MHSPYFPPFSFFWLVCFHLSYVAPLHVLASFTLGFFSFSLLFSQSRCSIIFISLILLVHFIHFLSSSFPFCHMNFLSFFISSFSLSSSCFICLIHSLPTSLLVTICFRGVIGLLIMFPCPKARTVLSPILPPPCCNRWPWQMRSSCWGKGMRRHWEINGHVPVELNDSSPSPGDTAVRLKREFYFILERPRHLVCKSTSQRECVWR